MKLPISWLNDFVTVKDVSVDDLSAKLVNAGFEIEEIIRQRDMRKNIFTAKVLSIKKHPEADKLDVCGVVSKDGKHFVIVTGAKNIKEGDTVPLALDGAELPNGKKIGDTVFRGITSQGMFCGGEELAITESDYKGASVNGVLIFDKDTPVGADINDVLGFDDIILDVGVTPNRPDCNSIIGLAREAAAVLKRPFTLKELKYKTIPLKIKDYINVEVKDDVLCPRYMAAYVKDVKIAESPIYIKKRLRSVGIKSINNIVDITNYILTEIGQPMHAFDLSFLAQSKIIVRRAAENEEIISLDGKSNILNGNMLVIADAEKPVAVAGIMGGLKSGINADTKNIVFESARFKRDSIRKTSKALNLKSDSQARYEKGVDFLSQELALKRALSLIDELNAGVIAEGFVDTLAHPLKKTVVKTTAKKINDILGITVPDKIISNILNSLEIATTIDKNGNLTAEAPLFREDILNANDLSEEVIRLYGYDKIVPTLLNDAHQTRGGKSTFQKTNERLKNALIGCGFNEIISFSFITGKAFDLLKLEQGDIRRRAIKLLNPLSEDLSVMRTTLTHSVLNAAAYNINKGNAEIRLFESAVVYLPDILPLKKLPNEKTRCALVIAGEKEDFYTLKGIIENVFDIFGTAAAYVRSKEAYLHPGRSADIYAGAIKIGSFGEVHPDVLKNYGIKDKKVFIAELDSDYIINSAVVIRKFRAAPKFPSVERDLAVIIDDTTDASTVVDVIKKYSGELLEKINVFDVFKGSQIPEGKKSLALSLVFQSYDRTLNDAEIKACTDNIIGGLKKEINGELR
ncbi:MAG: phenylalanine--tRNA ligase subunit beta [Clostridiales bacterium]|jgi:phenylalanyl-tRNA synthetase beta chain|nr:phenylalanine--tRNA ligase subunit beta [Clostridiales bacterium]